jgi:hypothetical protein
MAVQSSESKFVIEGIDARRIQAQFTRFQMAISLKKSLTDEGKFWSLVSFQVWGFSPDYVVVQLSESFQSTEPAWKPSIVPNRLDSI